MKCPTCTDATLVMTERQGIEIDYCPQCRGVWLDRGELDKLIDRAVSVPTTSMQQNRSNPAYLDSDTGRAPVHYRKRQKSWLNEIFD